MKLGLSKLMDLGQHGGTGFVDTPDGAEKVRTAKQALRLGAGCRPDRK